MRYSLKQQQLCPGVLVWRFLMFGTMKDIYLFFRQWRMRCLQPRHYTIICYGSNSFISSVWPTKRRNNHGILPRRLGDKPCTHTHTHPAQHSADASPSRRLTQTQDRGHQEEARRSVSVKWEPRFRRNRRLTNERWWSSYFRCSARMEHCLSELRSPPGKKKKREKNAKPTWNALKLSKWWM